MSESGETHTVGLALGTELFKIFGLMNPNHKINRSEAYSMEKRIFM